MTQPLTATSHLLQLSAAGVPSAKPTASPQGLGDLLEAMLQDAETAPVAAPALVVAPAVAHQSALAAINARLAASAPVASAPVAGPSWTKRGKVWHVRAPGASTGAVVTVTTKAGRSQSISLGAEVAPGVFVNASAKPKRKPRRMASSKLHIRDCSYI